MICLLIPDLLFVYYSKYNHQNLSLREFNLMNPGNLLNLIFTAIPFLGLLILMIYPGKADKKKSYGFLSIAILMNIPLVLSLFVNRFDLSITDFYLFGYPFESFYIALLFIAYEFFLVYLSIMVWLTVLNSARLMYFRSLIYTFVIALFLIVFAFFYGNLNLDKTRYFYETGKKSDVGVVLGAAVWSKTKPSPIFKSRLEKAGNIYFAGLVKKLQVTGGNAPGELTEAEVAYNYLVKAGVDKDDIWIEKGTTSTAEQIEFIKENLVEKKNLKDIVIVSDEFHLKRVMEMCAFYNIKAHGIASDLKLSWEKSFFYRFRDSLALLIFWFFAL